MIQLLRNINKYCLFVLVFSITFENWDPFKLVGTISVTYMASVLYILSWIPFLKTDFNPLPLKKYILPLVLFTMVGIFATALNSGYALSIQDVIVKRMVLLIILMFLIASHLYNDKTLVLQLLPVYVYSVVLMYVLFLLGMGTKFAGGRLLLFGDNPNALGLKAVIAFFIVLSNLLNKKFNYPKLISGLFFMYALLSLILLSASRGALLFLFVGIAVLVFFMKISMVKKMVLGVIGIVFSLFLFNYIIQTNVVFGKRLMRSIETGDTGRNWLWEAAFQIIEDNLFIGVGHPGVLPEMFKYVGRAIDPHNVFLYVLISTGVIGFYFYMLFLFRLGKSIYKSFRQTGEVVFMVIFFIILFNLAKSGGGIIKLSPWFFFAILMGSTFIEQSSKAKNT